jgi:hypothetical protein
VEFYLVLLALIFVAFSAFLVFIKYKEEKQKKDIEKPIEKPIETPVKFTAYNIRPTPITVELTIPREELLIRPQEAVDKELGRQLAKEVIKYADITTEENMMNFTTRIRARVWVVKDFGRTGNF